MQLIIRSFFVFLFAALPAAAETISGRARVVDGDTLAFGSVKVRLFGIDAPEHDQTCDRDGQVWACGQAAADALASVIGQARLVCDVQDRDRYGRAVSICLLDETDTDVGEALVVQGAAVAYQRYSLRYVAAETVARAGRVGIWGARMVPPEEYRRASPEAALQTACPIKGNIGSHGRIYHMPGQADYARTRIEPRKGEAWFCSEAQARTEGFRKARR